MRRLDKTKILSTEYRNWEQNLENSGTLHPTYNSSDGEFYVDIFTNLLHIQEGLCAYTESALCDKQKVTETEWENGRFKLQGINIKPFCKGGNLEHFNPDLKTNKAWLWDNFFFIDTDDNNLKQKKSVDTILKPDTPEYDEFRLLSYDPDLHIFYANTDLPESEQQRVNKMIDTLGLNLVKDIRRMFLQEKVEDIEFGKLKTWNDTTVFQFPTAFEMLKRHYTNLQ